MIITRIRSLEGFRDVSDGGSGVDVSGKGKKTTKNKEQDVKVQDF